MREYTKFYINGQWIDPASPKSIEVEDPSTEETCATISLGSQADVDLAVAAARSAFDSFSQTSVDERVGMLERVQAIYQRRREELAEATRLEIGAPIKLASTAQVDAGLAHISEAAKALKTFSFSEDVGPHRVVKEPIGVCGLITPWNWPLNQVTCKVAPALAMGCTMVLKPSEVAPLSTYLFAEIMDEAGIPPGVFNLVNGDGPTVGEALSAHSDVDMVSFTGSTRAGSLVAQSAAPTVKRVAQELGGKSPNIILDDADLEAAVTGGVAHMYINTGQSCNAPSRMLVPRALLAQAEVIAAKVSATVVMGPTAEESTTMGPVVSKVQWDKIQSLIEAGIEEGAKVVCGGAGLPEGIDCGYYVRPTVFSDTTNDMAIAKQEIFGPVLVMIPYDTVEEAIRIANDTPYGLSGYVQGRDLDRARQVAARIRAGTVTINGAFGGFGLPFGGYKQSGNGREWGAYGFEDYLELKAIKGYSEV